MKIDVTKIEGYADMTPEEKIAALESIEYEVPEIDLSGFIPKEQFDKASSELADWKKKYHAQLSEDEQKKALHEEELEALRREVEQNRREKTLATYKGQYMSMGYSEELAEETAKASLEGDTNKIFANHRKFLEEHDKALESRLIGQTPKHEGPGAKGSYTPKTKEEIMQIKDTLERQQAIAQNRELFE